MDLEASASALLIASFSDLSEVNQLQLPNEPNHENLEFIEIIRAGRGLSTESIALVGELNSRGLHIADLIRDHKIHAKHHDNFVDYEKYFSVSPPTWEARLRSKVTTAAVEEIEKDISTLQVNKTGTRARVGCLDDLRKIEELNQKLERWRSFLRLLLANASASSRMEIRGATRALGAAISTVQAENLQFPISRRLNYRLFVPEHRLNPYDAYVAICNTIEDAQRRTYTMSSFGRGSTSRRLKKAEFETEAEFRDRVAKAHTRESATLEELERGKAQIRKHLEQYDFCLPGHDEEEQIVTEFGIYSY